MLLENYISIHYGDTDELGAYVHPNGELNCLALFTQLL